MNALLFTLSGKKERLETVSEARNLAEAKRIRKGREERIQGLPF